MERIAGANVIAFDPAIVSAGLAVFVGGRLTRAHRIKNTCGPEHELAHRIEQMARMAMLAVGVPFGALSTFTLVYEWPKVYREAKQRGADANDLLPLAGVCGAFGSQLYAKGLGRAFAVRPSEWAGQLPKIKSVVGAFESARGRAILRSCTVDERAAFPRQHDALDAVGLGLWALGRFPPPAVYPGCT